MDFPVLFFYSNTDNCNHAVISGSDYIINSNMFSKIILRVDTIERFTNFGVKRLGPVKSHVLGVFISSLQLFNADQVDTAFQAATKPCQFIGVKMSWKPCVKFK